MILLLDLDSIVHNAKERFIIKAKRIVLVFYPVIFLLAVVFNPLNSVPIEAAALQNDKLIEKISKDYTNKFCNSVAFGLSKESAMNFANKENSMIFKKKKGVENLDKESIANGIAVSVVETCGYLINIKGQEGIMEFSKDYVSMNSF